MADDIAKKYDSFESDNEYSTEGSLLDSLLSLMTNQQREYFLSNSLSDNVVYANKAPSFNLPMCMVLTRTVRRQLIEPDNTINISDKLLHDDSMFLEASLDNLKSELEAGVQLKIPSGNWNYDHDNDDGKGMTVHIVTRRFSFACRLKKNGDDNVFLLATHVKNSPFYDKKPEDKEYTSDDLSEFEESVDNGFIDLSKSVQQSEKISPRTFTPHIKTVWNLYQSYRADIESFSVDAFENIAWQVSNKNSLSKTGYIRRKHLGKLEKVVNLSQLAMQFPYTAVSGHFCDEDQTAEYRSCKLRVHGPDEEVARISWAYVYADEKQQGGQHESRFHRMAELLKRRLKRIAVLELEGCKNKHHIFKISSDRSIPPEGYLVDVGLESQIGKQIGAIHFLANPKSRVHLLKLTSLLGRIDSTRFDDFNWKDNIPEIFDKMLTARQVEAVSKALNTPDICLIQGPPGTGKTRVISEIVQQASRKRWKTLLAAPTHVAVDNVLERIGHNDSISPIRCANKDKLADLPEHIQQFTFQNRKDSLVNRSQDKVKQDVAKLKRERNNLDKAAVSLKKLESLHSNVIRLKSQEQSLKKQLSSVGKTVQTDFGEELKDASMRLKEQVRPLKRSKKQFEDSQKTLVSLREKLSQFVSGSYTGKDKVRFRTAQLKVDETQGKVLKGFKAKLKSSEQHKNSIKKKIELTKTKIQNTNDILVLLDNGQVPQEVNKAIEAAVAAASAKHDRIIENKKNVIKKAHDRLKSNRSNYERLVG